MENRSSFTRCNLWTYGSGIGGMLSEVHCFNTGIPYVQKHMKGAKWLPFVIGIVHKVHSAHFDVLLFCFKRITLQHFIATRQIKEYHDSRVQQTQLR